MTKSVSVNRLLYVPNRKELLAGFSKKQKKEILDMLHERRRDFRDSIQLPNTLATLFTCLTSGVYAALYAEELPIKNGLVLTVLSAVVVGLTGFFTSKIFKRENNRKLQEIVHQYKAVYSHQSEA